MIWVECIYLVVIIPFREEPSLEYIPDYKCQGHHLKLKVTMVRSEFQFANFILTHIASPKYFS